MNLKYTRLLLTFHILVVFALSGCGFQPLKYFGLTAQARDEALHRQLNNGNQVFREKNFEVAAEIFERLVNSGNFPVERGALYGLACTRLVLAESDEEYRDAGRLLDQWREGSSETFGLEDPRMLLTVFSEVMPRRVAASPGNSDSDLPPEEPLIMRCFDYEKEINALRKRLADMGARLRAVESRNAAMKAMEKELEMLRNQIKTIEAIDQKIQEKKQGISSP